MSNNGITVTATGSASGAPELATEKAMAMAESAPIEAGSASVEVHLTVRFSQFPDDNAAG